MTISRIGVVGAGTMGTGIAQVCAQSGFEVLWYDAASSALVRAREVVGKGLQRLVQKNVLTDAGRAEALARLRDVASLDALADADLVIEAVAEDLGIKQTIFRTLDAIVREHTVLASNTSSLSITKIGAATTRPGRVLGMHFMNPVPVMALVEIVSGHHTSADVLARTEDVCRTLGKVPVRAADYPGFIANRILMPMINEACYTLMEGVASREAIDTVMKLGANHPLGPLALADLIGLDICEAILDVLHAGLGDPKYRACPLLRRMVAAGELGRKTGRGFYVYAA